MTFDKKDDDLIRMILRPVRGCATDSQYCDVYDRLATALTAVRREARAAAQRESDEDFIKLVQQLAAMNRPERLIEAVIEDVQYGAHRASREYALEAAANSVRDSEGEGVEDDA